MTAPVAALTGGTGFLGRPLAAALAARGYRVRLLVRRDPIHPQLRGLDFEIVPGGLSDPGALDRLVRGAAVVVHAAGLVKAARPGALWAANRDGTARLVEAMRQQPGRRRLVLVSSLAAREPGLSSYAASKRAGEAAAEAGLAPAERVIVRPTAIYGPWDRELLDFFRLADRGLMPVPGPPDARLTLIHVEDAAAAIAAIAAAAPGGGVHALADGNPGGYGWAELGQAMGAAFGGRLRPVRVPRLPIALFARAAAAAAWVSGRPAMLTPGKLRELTHRDWGVRPDELPPAGIAPPGVSLAQGLRSTVDWYRAAGWLPAARAR